MIPELEAALREGYAWAEARMTDTCTIYRRTGATTTDADGIKVPVWEVVYTGKCRLGSAAQRGQSPYRTTTPADTDVTRALRVLSIPASAPEGRDGDMADVTGEAGGVWQVIESQWQDQSTARRLPVVAADRPPEWDLVA